MKLFNKKTAGLVALAALSGLAFASAADSDFSDIVTKIQGWTDGSLGKVLSLAIFVVGIASGVVQQSLMAAVAGVAGAMIVHYGPNIIINVFGALV